MKKRRPYWNFWRVVLAGWVIRYPGKFFEIKGYYSIHLKYIDVDIQLKEDFISHEFENYNDPRTTTRKFTTALAVCMQTSLKEMDGIEPYQE